ncbi:MAG TPA: hypothetical protein VLX92_23065, partial [Kofleriaceae bacterium]|nr:hypothetical protein [Kofleriaceae bacterium]
ATWDARAPRRIAVVVLGAAAAIAPLAVARAAAWSSLGAARGLIAPPHHALALVACVALAAALFPVLAAALPGARWPALATAAGFAGIVSQLAGERPYATRFAWPLAIAFGLIVASGTARKLAAGALITSLVAVVLIYDGRIATGPAGWQRRYDELCAGIEYLRHRAPTTDPRYADVLGSLPRGATVAAWVVHPELLDPAALSIIDLRTPRTAALRDAPPARLAALIAATGARYLLVEADDHARARGFDNVVVRALCPAGCGDALAELASAHHVIAARDGVTLYDLQ